MNNYLNLIVSNLNRCKKLVVISIAIFILGLILGCVLSIRDDLKCIYQEYLSNYLSKVFLRGYSPIKLLFERFLNSGLILLLVAFLSLNKYTFYLSYLVIFYRAFILGLAGKLFITGALISGFFTFAFLIFVQGVISCFSIIVFCCLVCGKNDCAYKKLAVLTFKAFLISLSISLIGAIIEFLFIVCMFRPINVYF